MRACSSLHVVASLVLFLLSEGWEMGRKGRVSVICRLVLGGRHSGDFAGNGARCGMWYMPRYGPGVLGMDR